MKLSTKGYNFKNSNYGHPIFEIVKFYLSLLYNNVKVLLFGIYLN